MIDWIKCIWWDLKEWWFFRRRHISKFETRTIYPDDSIEIEGVRLLHVHDRDVCDGRVCVIHNPTDHHMRGWKLHWRGDRGIFERLCPCHKIGHPDPDQGPFWEEMGQDWQWTHGCCGACAIPEENDE